jgi:hypothetical protein
MNAPDLALRNHRIVAVATVQSKIQAVQPALAARAGFDSSVWQLRR